ncbi:hypothetical protein BVG79_01622 [Ketogulonicigenium robustum]|uniref:DUF599 domain-containing protein n=1 Tax=Ketogulonicigenium robustum TaxID=92947 RepID=A0A1W6P0C4_9RHOB|nr:DUF599 domain-containing protein [Ketogulonicigenium robustum]ARO14966.1 hypothetical protein BVG79_01622 [Ketogulonicigenium robustum]
MHLIELFRMVDWFDLATLAFVAVAWLGLGYVIENPPANRPSVSRLMEGYRRAWMDDFRARENRVFDSQIISSLRQSTSFFVSTCLLAVGGLLALMRNVDQISGVAEQFTHETSSQLLWQIRLLPATVFLVIAVLKFIWSNRLFGYCSILMGSVPSSFGHPEGHERANRAAELNIRAAVSFNRGLRAMYFALGTLAWVLGTGAMLVSIVAVTAFLWSREFASRSRDVMLEGAGKP